jgi:DNA-binding MarR family transcriptional regulator
MRSMAKAATTERDHVDEFLESIRHELPKDIDLTVEGIVDRITGLSRRVNRMMEETLAELELTWGEWKVLGFLLHQGSPHRSTPGQLAERFELSSGAMTNRLDQLESAGLIQRLPDPSDRRGVQVELTPAGRKAYKQATARAAAREALVVSALAEDEREQLNALLRKLMIEFEGIYPGHK